MTDTLGGALRAATSGSVLAYPLLFAAGAASSVGPCVAPRYVAVAALANASRRPWAHIGAFVTGLVGAYVALGLCAASLGALWSCSAALYAALAALLAVSGIITIARADGAGPEHGHARGACGCGRPAAATGWGGALLLGASSAFVVSPCCTPVIAAVAGFTTLSGRALQGTALLLAFACGHALPLLAAGALGSRLTAFAARLLANQAPAIVAGALMLALSGYYAVLA